ncbi:hypothetical protein P691DRAFT_341361 [Macrolepiota fuliginosa MF-IS2]|uniref:F-box domain-containing protein n=1 Tax=Macrolepiota fuliginosa MF-IS2 TaxID=1400762 RepID=A0A9P5X7B3_9AGAR|nr:hypothetical protein P691DRAFT_341361 [Macrolepiota fuliginosa MF-IS2]
MDAKRPSFSDTAAGVDRAIALVDTGVRGLFRMRVALRGQSNWHHSHICRLPPGTLSLIFQEICTPSLENWEDTGKINYHAITLASVSSYWRQVALGTAKMWNEMAFTVRKGAVIPAADLFQRHARRAKNLDLSVSIFFDGCSCDPGRFGSSDALENILFSDAIAPRIITLRLVEVPLTWGLTRRRWKLPRVRTMYISGAQHTPNGSGHRVLDMPSLHRLHVAGESWGSIVIPRMLRTLVLSDTLAATNVNLLSQCPDLIECYNRRLYYSRPSKEGFRVTYVWRRLESLTWSINELITLRSVENMKLPALKHLCLLDNDNAHNFNAIITFVHQTSATLTTLELQTLWDPRWEGEGQLARMFRRNFPNLQALKFTQSDPDNMSEVIRLLTPTKEEYHRGEVIPFPKLTLLVLGAYGRCYRASQLPQGVLRMLERRRAGEHVLFQFHLPDLVCWEKRESIWTPEVEEEYERVLGHRKMILFRDSKTWACFGLILYNRLSLEHCIQYWF